ncbi:MAG: serine/threonine protein kinase with repeat [Acidobacteria bacterium]|nr:serine/threonine protein kinase with repeat [Acidobacteriota bacterium]
MSEFPQSFDRFEIVRVLGRGGMGTVYLARDQRLGRHVALKVLNPDDLGSDDRRARFLREAKTAAAVRHQNVATIYEVGETGQGVPFLVMEYCDGETLSQRIRRKALDAAEFLSIARQIAAGVTAAHETGIVHRDIKSANVILEPTGVVKILDFGLAKSLQRSATPARIDSSNGHFFGTLHYVSPEQARGAQADARSDLFSIGIVLYQMASGHLPFNSEAPILVLEKIRDAEPEPFVPLDPALPTTVSKIIGRLLQKEPKDRYQSARELLGDLEEIETPTVRLTSNFTRGSSTLRRTTHRPHWLRFAVVAVTLLVVGLAVFFVRSQNQEPPPLKTAGGAITPIRSMAVLPLDNLAKNAKDDFLSVGLADALVTKLQQIPSLQVRPTSAVIEYHDKKIDARTASARLQVDSVLEGRFLAAGDLVRVNLQLTDARTGYNVWADTIDGKRGDLLKLIDDVSSRTVVALNEQLGVRPAQTPRSEARSTNARAYEEYLKSRALNGSLLPKEHDAQIAALKKAIELDPDFAAAYADLAIALSLGQARGLASDPRLLERAQWYARQAVRLDPNLAQAHLALGRIFVRDPERFRESMREILAAMRLNAADPVGLHAMTTYFISAGDLQKAQCVGDKLVAIDPNSNEAKTRAYWYINAVDPDGAIRAAEVALKAKDTELAGRDVRSFAFILKGNLEGATREAEIASNLLPSSYIGKSLKAMIAADRGDRPTAQAYLKAFEEDAYRYHWAALRQSLTYARLGDRDKAIAWMSRAAALGNHSWYSLVKLPWLAPLQADPEFQKIVGKMKSDLDDVADDVIGVYALICGGKTVPAAIATR